MSFWLTVRVAARALAKNKMRAGLTVLGIVIGVAAVIAIVSIGEGFSDVMQSQVTGLGSNVIIVLPASMASGGVQRGTGSFNTLSADDADAIASACPAVAACTPIVTGQGQVIYGNVNWSVNDILGVNESYLTVRNWPLARGGYFTERDIHSSSKVCVIGKTLVDNLFQTSNPIGKTIRIKNIPFVVIGVLEPKGANLVGQDQDNIVLAPYTTVKKRLRGSPFNNIDAMLVSARTADLISDAEQQIRLLLKERHRIKIGARDDFETRNTAEFARVLGVVTFGMTLFLAAIASVSLVVGGVGIMNIMLVSVTERTREIGIRLAVGARSADILRQFLIEAVLLSAFGGLVGVLLGVGGSAGAIFLINKVMTNTHWPVVISPTAVIVAVSCSALVGMAFGFFPALKASRLDPIDSLRYE